MDAVEFIREEIRMCASFKDCTECPICNTVYCSASPKKRTQEEAEEIVQRVEQWSAAHPRKTRQSVFLEQYPNARIDSKAVIYVCPADAYGDKVCPKNEENAHMPCRDCRRNFWLQEVE